MTSATADRHRLRTRELTGMSWAHFLNDGAANYLPGILPALLVSLNLSIALAGTIMGALLIGQTLQPLVGLLADRIGGRAMVICGLFGSSLGGALIGFAYDFWSLLAVLTLIGISNAFFHPQALAGVRQLSGHRPGLAMSVFMVGGDVGRGIWPAITSWLVVQWGLGYLWVLALPALLTLPFLTRWTPRVAPRARRTTPIVWRQHAGPMSRLVVFSTLRSLMIISVVTFVPLMWTQAGGSLITAASLVTVMLLVGVIGNVGGGRLSDRVGKRPLLVAAMVLAVAMLAVFLQVSGPWLWLVLGVLGISLSATMPLGILVAQDILPGNHSLGAGLALGLANGLAALGIVALGPVAALWGPVAPLWVALAGGIACIPLAMSLPEHAPPPR